MARYKGIDLDQRLGGVIRHMHAVDEYREVLQKLQAVWDNLALLGQMSGTGTDMNSTRQAFTALTESLLNQLGLETLNKTVLEMGAKTQVAIDILVRNLFERTADIGFLATDEDIRRYAAMASKGHSNFNAARELRPQREALQRRFAEYVAKYSVYSDIILLDTRGNVLARLDDDIDVPCTQDALLRAVLETDAAYVETYAALDLLPQQGRVLTYAYRVADDSDAPCGVLCLCFRFENEVERIFANLATAGDWSVILLVDAQGQVVASSDCVQLPIGARVDGARGEDGRLVRFGGSEYLTATRATKGYQGYMGPGWYGQVMLPVQHAFDDNLAETLRGLDETLLALVMENPTLFGAALRGIPRQAENIQGDLNRSLWNGNITQGANGHGGNPAFSKVLLREIADVGSRTREVFSQSISDLHETVVSAILSDCGFVASLAIDIMDRNLYERANDCRWWALTSAFREILAAPALATDAGERMAEILRTINGLYTVYSNLMVFDAEGRVLAVSQPDQTYLVGTVIHERWVKHVLALPDSQGYAVSDFAATPLYDGRHAYIYGAAIRTPDDNRVVGGVGIVFDSEPQFAAMLRDALPRDASGQIRAGCFGAFVDRSGYVVACTEASYHPGDKLPVAGAVLDLANGASWTGIERFGDRYYALGARMSSGYREYKSESDDYRNDIVALVFAPLCEATAAQRDDTVPRMQLRSDTGEGERVDIASFRIGRSWFGIRAAQVVEALEGDGIVKAAGAGASELAGYVIYRDKPISVYDIRGLANAGTAAQSARPQIIVIGQHNVPAFGVVAEELGDILEVFASRLQPMSAMFGSGTILAEVVVGEGAAQGQALLGVLSVERIAQRLRTAAEPAPITERRAHIALAPAAAKDGTTA